MGSSTTSAVYVNVIEDVMIKVREEFVNNGGAGEGVLNELQGLWEMKLMQAGAILGPIERPSMPKSGPGVAGITPVHDLNVPYEGTEEYETPTAEMLFPPTPLQTPVQTPMPGTADSSMYNMPTGFSDYPTPNSNEGAMGPTEMKPMSGRPSPYMQPPSPWMNQRPPLGVDVNVAYVEGRENPHRGASQSATQEFLTGPSGKRKRDEFASQYQNQNQTGGYIPQQDGAGDVFELEIIQSNSSGRSGKEPFASRKVSHAMQKGSASKIPQLDGPVPDPYEELSTPNIYNYQQGVVNEDYNAVNTPGPNDMQVGTPAVPAPNEDVEDDDDEPPLNENDDDDLDDIEGEELNTQHLVLAQFDKVTRTKSRWKCTLKDGIMHINNKDILFNKATGEFDF